MPYVRKSAGKVVGIFSRRQPGVAEEFLSDTDADLLTYRKLRLKRAARVAAAQRATQVSDLDARTRALLRAVKIIVKTIQADISAPDRAVLRQIQDVFDVDIKAVDDRLGTKLAEIDALRTKAEIDAYNPDDFS